MRVLVVSHAFPYPPYDGDLLPIYHFLRCLAPRAQYTLLTLRPAEVWRWEEGLPVFEKWGIKVQAIDEPPAGRARRAWDCLSHGRWWVNRFFIPEYARAVGRALAGGDFDVVHAEDILSAQHVPRHPPCGSVLIARDSLSLRHWRIWRHGGAPRELLQYFKIRWMERDLYGRFDRVAAISPVDQAEMARICPAATFDLLPNGVDLEGWRPEPEREEPDTVVFSGAMDYPPNIDAVLFFAREVWPLVRRRRPEARFFVVGRDPVPAVRALAAADASITVTGRVERIQDWQARAAVIVSPLVHGTGMKNKVLEGAAMGKAMVVTPLSLDGIDLAPGRDLSVAAEAGPFADEIVRLLENEPARRELGRQARAAVEQKYAWEVMAERLWASYQAAAALKRG